MSTPTTITIDSVQYVRADSVPKTFTGDVKIVVLQRGWVVIGHVKQDGDELTIQNASVIRIWGTTKGLGELVNGPLPKTVLDKTGTVRAHALAVVLMIDVDGSKWVL